MTSSKLALTFVMLIYLSLLFIGLPCFASASGENGYDANRRFARIAVLMVSDQRSEVLDGFRSAMTNHVKKKHGEYEYLIRNAQGDRSRLETLAKELIAAVPDIAVACGGVEADALKVASQLTNIPVVFLAASSTVERGLVASMAHPGGNITGIDTNDTMLTEKRLWYISKIWPETKNVMLFHVPDIPPSMQSVDLARKAAPKLGLDLNIVEVTDRDAIARAAEKITRADADAILLLPVATTDAAVKDILLPLSLREKIPIMGYNIQSIKWGATMAYGSSRRACGEQAANLAIKILHGANPAELPAETPEKLDLIINRPIVEQLELSLPKRVWRMASEIVDETF